MLIMEIIVVVYCCISIQLYILNLQIKLCLTTSSLCFSCRDTRYKHQAWVSQLMGQTCEDLEEFCDILI